MHSTGSSAGSGRNKPNHEGPRHCSQVCSRVPRGSSLKIVPGSQGKLPSPVPGPGSGPASGYQAMTFTVGSTTAQALA